MDSLADSTGLGDRIVTRSTSSARVAPQCESNTGDNPPTWSNAVNIKDFRPLFKRVYKQGAKSKAINNKELVSITSQRITVDDLLKLTHNCGLQKYISLIDNKIRFDELPRCPHSQIAGYMADFLCRIFETTDPLNVLFPASANDMGFLYSMLIAADVPLNAGTIKCPDASFTIRPRAVSHPPPAWLRFLPSGEPYPNLVVQVAVNNEGPNKLKEGCHRHFGNVTSVRIWIGIKVWIAGEKFWVGWADRAISGSRAATHSNMQFPSNHHDINVPINLVYSIPIQSVYGTGVAVPPNSPPMLDVDRDAIRCVIREYL
jgi:hypothetical protein